MPRLASISRWWALGSLLWALAPAPGTRAAEVAPFRLTSVTGFAEVRATTESDRSRPASSSPQNTRRAQAVEEEFGLATQSYFYHPNLAQLDLAAGLTLAQERARGAGSDEAGSGVFTRLLARLSLLQNNSFPTSLYYSRTTPAVALAVAERYRVTHTRQGANLAVRALRPFVASAEIYRDVSDGHGARQVTDETIDHLGLALHAPFHRAADLHGSLRFERRRSASGATGLPIDPIDRTSRVAELASSHRFGATGQVLLRNQITSLWESNSPRRRELRFSPSGQWQITDAWRGFGRYHWRDARADDTATTNRGLRLGLSHQLYDSLFTRLEARTEDSQTEGFGAEEKGLLGDLAYRKRLPLGRLEVTYRADYAREEQRATGSRVQVLGEPAILPDADPVALANQGVVETSVRVFNAALTQEFAADSDFRIFTVGAVTSVERLAGSRIAAGEAVLIDYSFAPAGSFAFAALAQTVGAAWSYQNRFTAYSRYRSDQRRRRAGTPLRALNSAEEATLGARVRVPLGGTVWGAEAEATRRAEELAPLRRQSYRTYLEGSGTRATTWHVGVRRLLVDYRDSPEDTALWGVLGRFDTRPAPRLQLGAEAGFDKDTGPTLVRRTWFAKLRGEWGIGALRVGAETNARAEDQGSAERRVTAASLYLRREF